MDTSDGSHVSYLIMPECYWVCMPWYSCIYVCMDSSTDSAQLIVRGSRDGE